MQWWSKAKVDKLFLKNIINVRNKCISGCYEFYRKKKSDSIREYNLIDKTQIAPNT